VVSFARDATPSRENVISWLNREARGESFIVHLDHEMAVPLPQKDLLNAICTHYEGVYAAVSDTANAWVQVEPTVTPTKGAFVVHQVRHSSQFPPNTR